MIVPDYAPVIEIKNKECWINVYTNSNGELWQGWCYPDKYGNKSDGIAYRIHVRLK